MADLTYRTYDVFTTDTFGGNPLAVVLSATRLTGGHMQKIAREFNYSETTFVLPPETAEGTAKIRIFTPTRELPFAGHPTIGTAVCLAEMALEETGVLPRNIVLEEGVGQIPCTIEAMDRTLYATLCSDVPLVVGREVSPETVAACLTLSDDAVCTEAHQPVFLSKGVLFLIAELYEEDDLHSAKVDLAAFRAAASASAETEGRLALVAYVRSGPETVEMRMMAPLDGTPEDPATGSAAAALGAYLCELAGEPVAFDISQGVAMGRPSTIGVSADSPAPGESRVTVAGAARKVMAGTIFVR